MVHTAAQPASGPVSFADSGRRVFAVEVEGLQGFVTPFGETRMTVDVPAGGHVDVHYALPRTTLSAGRLGTTPQAKSWGADWRNIAITFGGTLLLCCLCGGGVAAWEALSG